MMPAKSVNESKIGKENIMKANTDLQREKTITLRLSEEDARAINEMAVQVNMTASGLLETFIPYLTGGLYNNDSNEFAADRWFKLAADLRENSFLSYLCSYNLNEVQEVVGLLEDIEEFKEVLTDVKNDKMTLKELLSDLIDSEELREISDDYEKVKAFYIKSTLEELNWRKEQISFYWAAYQKESGTDETYEQAIKKHCEWKKRIFSIMVDRAKRRTL